MPRLLVRRRRCRGGDDPSHPRGSNRSLDDPHPLRMKRPYCEVEGGASMAEIRTLVTLTLADDLTITRPGYSAMQLAGPNVSVSPATGPRPWPYCARRLSPHHTRRHGSLLRPRHHQPAHPGGAPPLLGNHGGDEGRVAPLRRRRPGPVDRPHRPPGPGPRQSRPPGLNALDLVNPRLSSARPQPRAPSKPRSACQVTGLAW